MTVSNYCERCGGRVDVRAGETGEDDLGLDRIRSVFRYCSSCQLFVGRTCCWNPDVHACTDCGPPGSDQSVISPDSVTARKEIVIRRLADLSESVEDLQKVARVLDAQTAGGVALSASTWTDAWDASTWMIARADTSRDAVARALWPPPPERSRARFEQFHEELADLMTAYLAARASVEQRLTPAGQPSLASGTSKGTGGLLRGWRVGSRVPALMGSLAAGGLLRGWRAVSVATALVGSLAAGWLLRGWRRASQVPALMGSLATGWLLRGWRAVSQVPALMGSLTAGWLRSLRGVSRPSALVGAVIAVVVVAGGLAVLGGAPEMAILGGQGSPGQTPGTDGGAGGTQPSGATPASDATPTPDGGSEPAAPSVRANLDFDMLRVGALQGASDAIADIVGVNEVVPFPSPFDRSIRMVGSGTHQFCVSIPGLEPREVSVAVDLYAAALPIAALELAAVPSDGPATATGIPSDVLSSLVPERWYHLGARWQPGMPVMIEIRDGQGGELIRELDPASEVTPAATFEGVCLSSSGMASDGELMLDNLRVEQ
jgi:hypothetical protein